MGNDMQALEELCKIEALYAHHEFEPSYSSFSFENNQMLHSDVKKNEAHHNDSFADQTQTFAP